MSNHLFVIKNFQGIVVFYTDLEKAKNELKTIYNETVNFKYYSYEINVYELIENEYKITNESYIYDFEEKFQLKIPINNK